MMLKEKYIHFDRGNRLQLEICSLFNNQGKFISAYLSEFLQLNQNVKWLHGFINDKSEEPIKEIKEEIKDLEFCYLGNTIPYRLINDIVFEQIRRESYKEKPSRLYSIFFSDVNDKQKWEDILLRIDKPKTYVYELEIIETTKIHKTYSCYFERSISLDRYDEIVANANLYWKGIFPMEKPNACPEYLFVGSAKITEKVLIEPNK